MQRYELAEDVYAFERRHGLLEDDPKSPYHKKPPKASVALAEERRAVLIAEALAKRRQGGGKVESSAPLVHTMDKVWVKQPVVRPDMAATRAKQAAAAATRKALRYETWLSKHRAEIDSHARAVEEAILEDKVRAAASIEQTSSRRACCHCVEIYDLLLAADGDE